MLRKNVYVCIDLLFIIYHFVYNAHTERKRKKGKNLLYSFGNNYTIFLIYNSILYIIQFQF